MQPSVPRPRFALILTMAVLALCYAVFALSTVHLMRAMRGAPEVLTAAHELPQSDFGLFWCAGHGLADQAAARLGLPEPDAAYRGICRIDILADGAPRRLAWPYPPPMGFLVVPFSFFPLGLGFWLWRLFSLGVGAWLLRKARLSWPVIAAGLASPAALHDMTGGQNGTLTGAVLVASLVLAEMRPRVAGVLAGLLLLKPQMGLVFPAIIWRRYGVRLVLAGVVTGLGLVVAALAVWGVGPWLWFLHVAGPDEARTAALPFSSFFPAAGITVYDMARSFGMGSAAAWACQGAVAVAALGLLWAGWRAGVMQPVPRMAFSVSLGLLLMPHGFSYDLVAFSTGMAALFFQAGFFRADAWARLALALLWLMGGYTITLANYTGLLLFPLWAACGAALAWRRRAVISRGDLRKAVV